MKQLAPHFLLFTVLASAALPAMAQNTEQKVQGYVPPPLFGSPPAAQPRPAQPIVTPERSNAVPSTPLPLPAVNGHTPELPGYVKPRISRSDEKPLRAEPYIPKFPPMDPVPMEQTPAGRGLIVDRPASPKAAPLPPRKPVYQAAVTIPGKSPADAAPAAPAPAPETPKAAEAKAAPAVPAKARPAIPLNAAPAQKVTSQGVVTGPKTMPAAPTTRVESETVFTPTAAPAKTLLQQHIERQTQAEQDPAPPENNKPAALTPAASVPALTGKKQFSLGFSAGNTALSPDQSQTLNRDILPLLQQYPGARLQIQAFATPADKSQSSDRRISLSRALAIRDMLMDQGIEPRRIDVRALGTGPDGKAADRVDLVVSGS